MPRPHREYLCACGCGETVPAKIDPKTGKHKGHGVRSKLLGGYFIVGHGRKVRGRWWSEKMKIEGHPQAKPIGSTFVDGPYIREKVANQVWRPQHRLVAGVDDVPWTELHVHHKDGDGFHNTDDNLEPLTPKAHVAIHRSLNGQWSHEYENCVECGETSRPHQGKGLCGRCYVRRRLHAMEEKPKAKIMAEPCADCCQTSLSHGSHGLCATCYQRNRYRQRNGLPGVHPALPAKK